MNCLFELSEVVSGARERMEIKEEIEYLTEVDEIIPYQGTLSSEGSDEGGSAAASTSTSSESDW